MIQIAWRLNEHLLGATPASAVATEEGGAFDDQERGTAGTGMRVRPSESRRQKLYPCSLARPASKPKSCAHAATCHRGGC